MTPRILAIDDSDQNLLLIELYLQDEDFELVLARSGREALDLTSQEAPDLILLDLVMPGMDGLEVCRRLKADPRTAQVPVIFLTGRMQDEAQMMHAYAAGAVDYISKPVHKGQLVARIKVMLKLRRERAELERDNLRLITLVQESEAGVDDLEAVLAETQELLRIHADAECGYLLVDREARIEVADAAASELLGVDPSGKALAELLGPGGGSLDQPMADGQVLDLGVNTGQGRSVLAISQRSLGQGYRLLCLRDVSAQRDYEQRLRDRQICSPPSRARAQDSQAYRVTGLIGSGRGMAEVSALVDKLRNVSTSVLIQGETGTGKELVARALHYDGRFANAPFIPIHCGAISPELIESELFGYEKGAFTGATIRREGLFKAADCGAVFLDEVSETSPDLQVKLLRVLQLGEIRPVGATHAQYVDVRIIAATNQDLRSMVQQRAFREDLFYRLGVVTIRLPALRDRPEDIVELAEHIAEQVSERQGRPRLHRGISQGAMNLLRCYPWPGNVRELENVIEAAISLGCGQIIQDSDLPEEVRTGDPAFSTKPQSGEPVFSLPRPREVEGSLASRSRMVVRSALLDALSRFSGDKVRAAHSLGMSRSTFYRKLKEHGVG